MKRLICLFLIAVLLLSGCYQTGQQITETTAPVTEAQIPETQPQKETVPVPSTEAIEQDIILTQKEMASVFIPVITEQVLADDGTRIFSHTYQSMSLVLQDPDVAEKIILHFLNRVDAAASIAQQTKSAAQEAYTPSDNWVPYLYKIIYTPMRIDQSVLSLFGTTTNYIGGVHPDHYGVSVNYDLLTGDVLTLGSIMHKDAATDMFCQLVLEELAGQSDGLYLFSDFESTVQKRFAQDPSQDEGFYFTPTGLCFYFSPYEIAPYSSGIIAVEIPYEKLPGLLNDAYFPGERHLTDGVVTITPFEETDLDALTQISEAVLSPDGEMLMVTASNLLENVRIYYHNNEDPENSFYTFFAVSSLAPGDGIMIQAEPDTLSHVFVEYLCSDGWAVIQVSP